MQLSEFFKIFNLNSTGMEKVSYFVSCHDYQSAKKELLRYFITRKANHTSSAEPVTQSDKNFSLAYIARHFILSGPNENDVYLSSMFLAKTDEYTTMDIMPFLKADVSFMIMSRQKEKDGAFFYSPSSIFPPFVRITTQDGEEIKISPSKYAYVSAKTPDHPLSEEDIYEICEDSDTHSEAYGDNTGRVYMGFDFSKLDLSRVVSARFHAKITLPENIETKELLFFNISDSSWDNNLTWSSIKGNVYSWENSPTGPEWISPKGSDSEYLNVTCRFWFARPMAYQYLSDVEKNKVYGEKLLFLMDAFSKKKDGGFNRVLETGERLSNFACVLNALIDTPVMTEDYLISILWIMYRDMKHLIENPDLGWSNWAVVRTSGLSKAIDFLPELNEHEEWKNHTRELMGKLFDRMYSPDFSFREAGLAYSFWCMNLFSSAVKSAEINNDPYSAFMRSRLEKAFDASLDALYPNFYDTNIGDSNYQDKTEYLKSVGSLFPTKKLKAFVTGNDDPTVPLSVCYPDSGSVIMRNSFKREKSLYLALHACPFDGHAHSDLLSLVIYGFDKPLITDSGRYGYSASDIAAHLKTPAAHNSVEVEGVTYLSHSESKPRVTSFVSNKAFDFALSEAVLSHEPFVKHSRRVLFVKDGGFFIVSDYVKTDKPGVKFNQHWHFMPHSFASVDFNDHVKTNFTDGANIKIVCPDSPIVTVSDDIFSSGYGIAASSLRATFSKFGENASFTTILHPFTTDVNISASSLTPDDNTFSSAVFDVNNIRGVFYAKNEETGKFLDCFFDGDMAFLLNGRFFISGGKTLSVNSTELICSPDVIPDMYLHISSGIVEIESSSLKPSTKRDEAIRIYAPKTTHVIFNGESIPFTLYSDYVYAVTTK